MTETSAPRQGDVWQAQILGKNRPQDRDNPHHIRLVVVVSTDLYNEYELAYLVAPVLPWTDDRGLLPTNLTVQPGDGGIAGKAVVFTTQIRTIAPWRVVTKVGVLQPSTVQALKDTLRITFDLL